MFPTQIPPIISPNRRSMAGGQKGCSAETKENMTPPRKVDHGKGKKMPFSVEHKKVEPVIETVPNQASSKGNKADKLLNEELLSNDSPGG